MLEVRYHFKENYKGFYANGHVSYIQNKTQKGNTPYFPDYYQKEFGYLLGAAVEYQLPIAEKWNLDYFVRGVWQQGFYKGFSGATDERVMVLPIGILVVIGICIAVR